MSEDEAIDDEDTGIHQWKIWISGVFNHDSATAGVSSKMIQKALVDGAEDAAFAHGLANHQESLAEVEESTSQGQG